MSQTTNMVARVIGRESRRHLRATKVWLYLLSLFQGLFLVAAGFSRVSVGSQVGIAALVAVPLFLMVAAGKHIARFERGEESALPVAMRYLRYLWVTVAVSGLLMVVALVAFIVTARLR